ncbi:MAG: hypothetical protein WBC63_07410, partial [Candidatus Bipolaricaulia bacterium]
APNVDPITPLITVDNGGDFADGAMTVTIPVTIPAGYFAMGFFVDENGKLEGMPLVAETPTSITVATAHFSSFFIAMIADSLLTGTIDTGFRPMTDDRQFANRGSYIAPGGHCAGQALTGMWYYLERTQQGTSTLWNRFDNNGDAPATPDLWEDDSLGYRLASVVQLVDWSNLVLQTLFSVGAADDPLNWSAFLYAMLITGEPQYVAIYNRTVGGGHAMIVYKANADTGTLYIADLNYPGNSSRTIQYANGAFSPYNSGANKAEIDAGKGKAYEEIRYYAKTALVDWSEIAMLWDEFDAGTIGDGIFPAYVFAAEDNSGGSIPLTDGMVISGDKVHIVAVSPDPAYLLGVFVYRGEERLPFDSDGNIDLLEGNSRLGIYVLGKVGDKWKYVDFHWVTLRRTGAGYIAMGVTAHAWFTVNHPNDPDPVTGAIGETYRDDDPFRTVSFKAYANRAFTGNTFTAQWSGYYDGLEGPYTGSMTVTFSESMDEIISFSASGHRYDAPTSEFPVGETHTWSASGSNIPRARIGNGFHEYIVEKAACCNHLNTFTDASLYNTGDSNMVTHFTCDVYSRIAIQWYEVGPRVVQVKPRLVDGRLTARPHRPHASSILKRVRWSVARTSDCRMGHRLRRPKALDAWPLSSASIRQPAPMARAGRFLPNGRS